MFFVLENFLGFLLQAAPGILLCAAPFPSNRFAYSKGKCLAGAFVWTFLMAAGFAGLMYWADLTGKQFQWNLQMIANSYMLANVGGCVACFFLLVKESVTKKLMVLCLVLSYAVMEYLGVNIIGSLLPSEWMQPNHNLYQPAYLVLYFVFTIVTFPVFYISLKGTIRRYLQNIESQALRKSLAMVLLVTSLYVFYGANIGIDAYFFSTEEYQKIYISFLGSFIFCTACLLLVYWFLFWEIRVLEERMNYRHQLEIQQIQYQKIIGEIEMVRRTRHDLRHHLHLMEQLINEQRWEEAKRYLQTNALKAEGEIQSFSKDPLLNALLQYYAMEAKEEDILFEAEVSLAFCPIDPADMTVLLGNMLENALHASRKVQEHRMIHLKIGQVNTTLVLLMENSCQGVQMASPLGKLIKNSGEYQTASAFVSQGGSGIGLKSMEATAKKYGGTAEFRYSFPTFYTRVGLEIPFLPKTNEQEHNHEKE